MTRYRVAAREDVPEGSAIVADAGEKRLALCNVDGTIHAIDDVCTHDGGPLGEGELFGYEIECPRHGARFDVRTGRVTRMPAVAPVKTYPVEQEAGDLFVDVDDDW
jgi:3-phenylpropionate/trans-cinnamate dioxygenase ferredoxin subunit